MARARMVRAQTSAPGCTQLGDVVVGTLSSAESRSATQVAESESYPLPPVAGTTSSLLRKRVTMPTTYCPQARSCETDDEAEQPVMAQHAELTAGGFALGLPGRLLGRSTVNSRGVAPAMRVRLSEPCTSTAEGKMPTQRSVKRPDRPPACVGSRLNVTSRPTGRAKCPVSAPVKLCTKLPVVVVPETVAEVDGWRDPARGNEGDSSETTRMSSTPPRSSTSSRSGSRPSVRGVS